MKFQVLLLYLITFTDLFAVGMVVPLISSHITSLGGSHFIVGLMGSFYSGVQLFSGPLIGSLSDIKGRKNILVVSLLCCSIAYMLFGFISSLYVLLILRLIIGLFKHTQTLAKAVVSDIVKNDDQSDTYGKMAAISGAGISLGPMIGGHISEDHPESGFMITCLIASALFIINAGIVYFILSSNKKVPKETVKLNKTNDTEEENLRYLEIVKDSWNKSIIELKEVDWKNYWDVFLLKALASFIMGIFYSNYAPLLKIHFGLSPKWIGYTISFQGVIGSLCSFFIKYINRAFYKNDVEYTQRNFHCFLIIFVTLVSILICNNWYIFAMLLIPLAASNTVLRLIGLEIIVHKSPANQRGSLIGASNSVRSLSGITAPIIAGYMADLIGVQYVLIISLISACVGVVITGSISLRENKISSKKIR